MSTTDFTSYLSDYSKNILKNAYGNNYPELVDYEMRQYSMKLNTRYKQRFGYSINDLNQRLFNDGIYVDSTPGGYLYGNVIEQTWEWANAVTLNDQERMEYLIINRKIEESKLKAMFIEYNIDKLIDNNGDGVSKHSKASQRKQRMDTNKCDMIGGYQDEKDVCGYHWI